MATILSIVNKTEIYFILFRSNETNIITTSLVLDPERSAMNVYRFKIILRVSGILIIGKN